MRGSNSCDIAVCSVHPFFLSFVQLSLEVTISCGVWKARERPVSVSGGVECGDTGSSP